MGVGMRGTLGMEMVVIMGMVVTVVVGMLVHMGMDGAVGVGMGMLMGVGMLVGVLAAGNMIVMQMHENHSFGFFLIISEAAEKVNYSLGASGFMV